MSRYSDYIQLVQRTQKKVPSWRKGQTCFNVLCKVAPELAEKVRGDKHLDPFYQDSNIADFLVFVLNNMEVQDA